mgnify:CR=1 FL=1
MLLRNPTNGYLSGFILTSCLLVFTPAKLSAPNSTTSLFVVTLKLIVSLFWVGLPKSVNNIWVDVNIKNKDGVPDHTLIDINKFHVEMAENPVDMRMHIATPVSDPTIDGEIKGKVVLNSVKEFIPLEADQKLSHCRYCLKR